MDNTQRRLVVDSEGRININDPRVQELGLHAEAHIFETFIAKHPELLNVDLATDARNRQVIEAIIDENNLALTPESLELAYRSAVEAGQLQFAMYHPLEIEAFPRMTTKQMAEYLRQRYQAPPPPNAAELLPQFGERRWRNEGSTMTDEQSQVLRDKLLKGAGW